MSWIPRLKTRTGQCDSCPFLKGNNAEWLAICNQLRTAHGLPPGTLFHAGASRYEVMKQVRQQGDFACHHTVYDQHMQVRDQSDHLQCPGATAFHEEHRAKKGGG